VIAARGRIAAHEHEVREAQRRGPEDVGLDRDAVAVAARHLHHGLDAAIQQQFADGARIHRHARAGRFGDVDRIDRAAQQLRRRKQFREVDSFRGSQLAGDDELAGGHFGREA
jgi:hypothetical protein